MTIHWLARPGLTAARRLGSTETEGVVLRTGGLASQEAERPRARESPPEMAPESDQTQGLAKGFGSDCPIQTFASPDQKFAKENYLPCLSL
jgi:hypothetical protein